MLCKRAQGIDRVWEGYVDCKIVEEDSCKKNKGGIWVRSVEATKVKRVKEHNREDFLSWLYCKVLWAIE